MKTLLTTVLLTTVCVLLCAILSADADQTIFEKELVERRPDYEDILAHHAQYDKTTAQRRENPHIETLGFVTPWNNRGYDIVKWFRKFTMVSPVWFVIHRVDVGKYQVGGDHDVDISWMEEVRGKDSRGDVVGRIIPRYGVGGWDRDAYQELLGSPEAQQEFIRIVVDHVKKHEFDGVVLEIAAPQYFEGLISALADSLHGLPGEKRLVVVLPPFVPGYPSAEILFNPNVHVDFFALMTYDANVAAPGPNAPIEWIEEQITHYIGNKPLWARKKLLLGLNMYGAIFTPTRSPIKGDEYLNLLEKYKPSLEWDKGNEELFWEFSDEERGITDGEVWYPSLYSIKKRLQLIEDMEIGGVSIWELGQGLDYFYELL